MPTTTAVAWFRRDLRLADHPALAAALADGREVVPLYVLDPRLLVGRTASPNRAWYLLAALRSLDAELRARGSRLVVRAGDPVTVVPGVAGVAGADEVRITREVSPYGRARDRRVAAALEANGTRLRGTAGLLVHEPEAVLTADGRGFTVFGAYRRSWGRLEPRPPIGAPVRLPAVPRALDDLPIPSAADLGIPPPTADPTAFPEPGEPAARARLERWLRDGLSGYAAGRDRLGVEGTSRLSQDLKFGFLSPTEVAWRVAASRPSPGRRAFLDELAWRDFYLQLLWQRPAVLRQPFQAGWAAFPWADDPAALEAWRSGRTGVPIVDAAMRQLLATGFMPNRARMVVASFLAKDLMLDWRAGEDHFMRHLLDGDPAANDGGWQWSASTGTDAQPWFRILNPVRQGEQFDPDGTYVRRWVPEVGRVPGAKVHAPWTMTPDEQLGAGCRIGLDYPAPIVDHGFARARWLEAARATRERAVG